MKKLLLSLLIIFGGFGIAAATPSVFVYAQEFNDQVTECQKPELKDSEFCKEYNNDTNTLYGPDGILTRVITLLNVVIGIAGVVTMIIAGIRFTNSGGDPQKVSNAKNTVIYGAVGLALAAMSQLIVVFIISEIGQ